MAYNSLSPTEIQTAIQEEAKKLFLEHGIADTQMKSIAQAVGIGRSTLYRYYKEKEQIAFLVTCNIINELSEKNLFISRHREKNGFEQLRLFCERYIDLLAGNINILNYLTEFDRLFEAEYPDYPEANLFIDNMSKATQVMTQFIERGIYDKSIKTEESPTILSSVLINTIFGVSQRVLTRSAHIEEEQGAAGEDIVRKAVQLILHTIKA